MPTPLTTTTAATALLRPGPKPPNRACSEMSTWLCPGIRLTKLGMRSFGAGSRWLAQLHTRLPQKYPTKTPEPKLRRVQHGQAARSAPRSAASEHTFWQTRQEAAVRPLLIIRPKATRVCKSPGLSRFCFGKGHRFVNPYEPCKDTAQRHNSPKLTANCPRQQPKPAARPTSETGNRGRIVALSTTTRKSPEGAKTAETRLPTTSGVPCGQSRLHPHRPQRKCKRRLLQRATRLACTNVPAIISFRSFTGYHRV